MNLRGAVLTWYCLFYSSRIHTMFLLEAYGFDFERVGKSGDGGIDLIGEWNLGPTAGSSYDSVSVVAGLRIG